MIEKTPKMMKICILLSFFCLTTSLGISQQVSVTTPSPNISAAIEYANIPVDYSTGIPSINVDLFSLPARDIDIPINLNYHSAGNKVQEIASMVGLGWSLNAGGFISRTVRGKEDQPFGREFCKSTGGQALFDVASKKFDGEPDIFYFNILGQTSKFFLDEFGNAYTMPYSNYKIEYTEIPAGDETNDYEFSTWKITDDHGYQYYFGNGIVERLEYNSYPSNWSPTTSYTDKGNFNNTWYLINIRSPSGLELASFDYETGTPVEYTYYSEIEILGAGGSCGTNTIRNYAKMHKDILVTNPRYLSKINTSSGSVQFGYSSDRRDLKGGRIITSIILIDSDLNEIKKYEFNYSYFEGYDAVWSTTKNEYSYAAQFGCENEFNCLRLRLDDITLKSGNNDKNTY